MKLAFVVYEDFAFLDLAGPYEVLTTWPDAEVHVVATTGAPVRGAAGMIVVPTATTATLTDPDVVVVPGSGRPLVPLGDAALLDWVRAVAPGATWTASVCTGAGVLAASGVLEGRRAATHWAFRDALAAMGADVADERVVFDGPVVTCAGVSAGIDMALALTARVHGRDVARGVQLALEYDPQPPFDTGTPAKAGAALTDATRARMAALAAA